MNASYIASIRTALDNYAQVKSHDDGSAFFRRNLERARERCEVNLNSADLEAARGTASDEQRAEIAAMRSEYLATQ